MTECAGCWGLGEEVGAGAGCWGLGEEVGAGGWVLGGWVRGWGLGAGEDVLKCPCCYRTIIGRNMV